MTTGRKLLVVAFLAVACVILAASLKGRHENAKLDRLSRLRNQAERLNGAITAGDVAGVKTLLAESGGDSAVFRVESYKGTTPLNCAVQSGRKEIVGLLMVNGAGVNVGDGFGLTPLHCAAGRGDKPMLEFLLSNGAKVNAKTIGGVTPLHMAVNSRQREAVELLVAKGADINAKSITPEFAGPSLDDLYTPLQWAVKTGQNEVADFLRKNGARD